FVIKYLFFFSSRRRHTRFSRDWSSDVCSSDLAAAIIIKETAERVAPFVPANQVLNSVKSEFKKEAPIDGSWIYMKTEDFHNGVRSEERRVGKECRYWWL